MTGPRANRTARERLRQIATENRLRNHLGATLTGPTADLNLGIHTFVNGTPMDPIQLDTSAAATDTIQYVVTDPSGLTSTTTRTVIVEAAQQPTSPTTSPDQTAVTATTTTDMSSTSSNQSTAATTTTDSSSTADASSTPTDASAASTTEATSTAQ